MWDVIRILELEEINFHNFTILQVQFATIPEGPIQFTPFLVLFTPKVYVEYYIAIPHRAIGVQFFSPHFC